MCVHVATGAHWGRKRALSHLESESHMTVTHSTRVLGTELGASGGAGSRLNCQRTSPAPSNDFLTDILPEVPMGSGTLLLLLVVVALTIWLVSFSAI